MIRERVSTSRVKEEVARLHRCMLEKGVLYNVEVQPVKGDRYSKWIVISD